ncbi:expressed unknown protein [Seminavis robusta]|uniref:Coiled-coil domain-containing protein 86 n=1 Tax=Seminavis robusta TaxID=568900 RepID=A0A9N8DAY5_9STRA|nr:expressed unknown protein [Seminavis robusta]|eukprot:Sro70_g038910.1 n/a (151) ;mRNA; r:62521-62973
MTTSTTTAVANKSEMKAEIPLGRNASGRSWKKVATKRSSSLTKTKVNNQTKTWEQRRAEKLHRKEVLELQKQLTEERVKAIRDKKERRLENEKRRTENEYEHAKKLSQSLNNSKLKSTLKTMSKKQLRQIKKTRVNTKTGAVEFIPAYSK